MISYNFLKNRRLSDVTNNPVLRPNVEHVIYIKNELLYQDFSDGLLDFFHFSL